MCSKRNELWNTSLLFDLNYKFELIGASLLALAKSIYFNLKMQRLQICESWRTNRGRVPTHYLLSARVCLPLLSIKSSFLYCELYSPQVSDYSVSCSKGLGKNTLEDRRQSVGTLNSLNILLLLLLLLIKHIIVKHIPH